VNNYFTVKDNFHPVDNFKPKNNFSPALNVSLIKNFYQSKTSAPTSNSNCHKKTVLKLSNRGNIPEIMPDIFLRNFRKN
jgi:hypothetical protein